MEAIARTAAPDAGLRGCISCGLVQRVGTVPPGFEARCARCGGVIRHAVHPRARERVVALSLAALILYPLSMSLPVMEITRMGHRHSATIWSGVIEMLRERQLAVGVLIFVCSVLVPLMKIGGMFLVCWRGSGGRVMGRRGQMHTYRLIEWIGRWGMVDVLLIALLVATVKLGNWVDVHPGPGVTAFAGVVVLSLLASASFDPAAIWEEESA
jgi:uncharacterized paraquat-inducible protein A